MNGIHTQKKETETKQTEQANSVTDGGGVTGANRMVWAGTKMAGGAPLACA